MLGELGRTGRVGEVTAPPPRRARGRRPAIGDRGSRWQVGGGDARSRGTRRIVSARSASEAIAMLKRPARQPARIARWLAAYSGACPMA